MKAKKLKSAYFLAVQNLQMQRVDLVAFVGTDHEAQQTGDAASGAVCALDSYRPKLAKYDRHFSDV